MTDTTTPQALTDAEGENRAVRCFLMAYGTPGLTVGSMKRQMRYGGFPHWPEWVEEQDDGHLTKAGAQLWLRHLFALESEVRASSGKADGLPQLVMCPACFAECDPRQRPAAPAQAAVTDEQIDAIVLRQPFVNMNALDRGDLRACIREVLAQASPAQPTQEPDYEAMEREHFGDPDKGTGIYATPSPQESAAAARKDGLTEQEVRNFLAQFDKAREDFNNWPKWMQDAARVAAATFPRSSGVDSPDGEQR